MNRDSLATALDAVAPFFARRSALPVLAGVVLGPSTVTAFNYEVAAEATIDDTGLAEPVLVAGWLFKDAVAGMPRGSDLTFTVEARRLVMKSGRRTVSIPTLPIEDYPTPPKPLDARFDIALPDFAHLCKCLIAAGRDDTLPTLMGVHADLIDGVMTFAGTDRYRLVTASAKVDDPAGDGFTALIPATLLRHLAKVAKPNKALKIAAVKSITMSGSPGRGASGENWMTFRLGDRLTITTRTIDGEFPKYRTLIPDDKPTSTATVNRKELIDAVAYAARFAERNTPVRLAWSAHGVMEIAAGAGDDCRSHDEIPAFSTTVGCEVTFNPVYLLEILRTITTDTVTFEGRGIEPSRRLWVLAGDDDAVFLLMPVRLTS